MTKFLETPLDKQREITILINTKNNNCFDRRTCIIPKYWDYEKIISYLEYSMSISKELITFEGTQDVMISYKSIKNFEVNNKKLIDYYWYDVKEFIIEVQNKLETFCFTLVAGYDANEIDIAEHMNDFFPATQIRVDYYRDSWLSKNINS